MIALPDFVATADVDAAEDQAAVKKEIPGLVLLCQEKFFEGPAAQILYVGAYADEGSTIASIHQFIEDYGHSLSGRYHEINLSDPQCTDPKSQRSSLANRSDEREGSLTI